MALSDILSSDKSSKYGKRGIAEDVSRERIANNLEEYQKLIAFWRVYPDKFVDYLCSLNPHNTFKLYFCQRIYLRACLRYKYLYCVYPRGYGKSFLAVLSLIIKCILYPNSSLFVAAGGKEQSGQILQDKVKEICRLIPAIGNEIVWDTRGAKDKSKTRQTRDSVSFSFKNGSSFENLSVSEKSRGRRFKAGLLEEVITIDQKLLNEVVLPGARRLVGRLIAI